MSWSLKILFDIFEWSQLSWRWHGETVLRHAAWFWHSRCYLVRNRNLVLRRLWVNDADLREVAPSNLLYLSHHRRVILIHQGLWTRCVRDLWQMEVGYWWFTSLLQVLWALWILVHPSYNFVVVWIIWHPAWLLSSLFSAQDVSLGVAFMSIFAYKALVLHFVFPFFPIDAGLQRILQLSERADSWTAFDFKFEGTNLWRCIYHRLWHQSRILIRQSMTVEISLTTNWATSLLKPIRPRVLGVAERIICQSFISVAAELSLLLLNDSLQRLILLLHQRIVNM